MFQYFSSLNPSLTNNKKNNKITKKFESGYNYFTNKNLILTNPLIQF